MDTPPPAPDRNGDVAADGHRRPVILDVGSVSASESENRAAQRRLVRQAIRRAPVEPVDMTAMIALALAASEGAS